MEYLAPTCIGSPERAASGVVAMTTTLSRSTVLDLCTLDLNLISYLTENKYVAIVNGSLNSV
jgi:hypothetical protein